MIWPIIAYTAAALASEFIPPIDTMDDVKGEITYVDRERNFFLIIEGSKFYIGHPNNAPQRAGSDVPYTWGEVADCSTSQLSCVRLGNEIYIRSKGTDKAATYADRTIVSAWTRNSGNWSGTGVMCAPPAEDERCRPVLTYFYDVDEHGTVSRIVITFWGRGLELKTYDLLLASGAGIRL